MRHEGSVRFVALVAAVLSLGAVGTSAQVTTVSAAAEHAGVALASETTLRGATPGWTDVVVPRDVTISAGSFTASAPASAPVGFALASVDEEAAYVIGLRYPEALAAEGQPAQQVLSSSGGDAVEVTAGTYRLFLLVPDGTEASVQLHLPQLSSGTVTVVPEHRSSFTAVTSPVPGGSHGALSRAGSIESSGVVVAAASVVGAGPRVTRANGCIYLDSPLPAAALVATPDCVPPVTGGGLSSRNAHYVAADERVVGDRLVVAAPAPPGTHTVAMSTLTTGTASATTTALVAWISFG